MNDPAPSHFRFNALTRLSLLAMITVALASTAAPLRAATSVWQGNGADNNWTTPGNFSPPYLSNNDLVFQGSNYPTNNNDNSTTAPIHSLTFDPSATAFTLVGRPIGFFEGPSLATNTIRNNSSNTQTLSFFNSYNGGAVVSDFNLTFDAAAGDITLTGHLLIENFTNTADEGAIIVTGSHTTTLGSQVNEDAYPVRVIKNGSGALILGFSNSYTGGTTINSGVVQLQNGDSLGSFQTNGNFPSNDTHLIGGTLQTNVPLVFHVPGNYFQTGGTLRLQVGGLTVGNSDLMLVDISANLGGNLFIHQFGGFTPVNGDRVTVIRAQDTLNGTFASFADDFPGLIQAVPDYSIPNQVDIVFQVVPFSSLSGLTPNQQVVANELDEVANDSRAAALINFLGMEPVANLPHDFDLIAPEELASIYEIGFSQAVVHNDNLMRRMDEIRAGSNGYCGPTVEVPTMTGKDYNPPIQDKNVVIPDKNVASTPVFLPCPENRWGVFVTGTGDFVNVGDEDKNARGYDLDTGSVTVGADYRVGNHFAIGVDGSFANSRADLVDDGRVEVDGGKIGGYATAFGNGLWGSKLHLDAAVGGGWNSYDTRRTGLEDITVRGSTNGSEFNALIAYGADWTFGCFNIGTWSTLQYTNVGIDRFTEEGSLAPLEIQDQDEDSLRGTTGARASYDVKFGRCAIVRPEVRAAWQHEYNDRAYPIDSRFASGAGDVFRVHGPSVGRDAALIGAGLNVQWCSRFATYVYYDGVLGRSNYDNNAVSAGLRLGF
jgi:outer membrane autotransporter protein